MKFIEFITGNEFDNTIQAPLLIDISEISSLKKHNEYKCILYTKHKQVHYIYGNYTHLQNRLFYCLQKNIKILEDNTFRPSLMLFYGNHKELECDTLYFDIFQICALLRAFQYEYNIDEIFDLHLREEIKKTLLIFD